MDEVPLPKMTYSHLIADFIWRLRRNEVPMVVKEKARSCTLYALAMGMASMEDNDTVLDALSTVHRAPGEATVMGRTGRLRAADAAAINAALIGNRGQNDTHPATVTHIGCTVVPAVLALAEERNASLEQALTAILVGYEVIPKIARGAAAQAIARGFRSTSIFGVIGVAAACACLLELDVPRIQNAIAIATNAAGGVLQCWEDGSAEWRFHVAHASRLGVEAALLAEHDFTGADRSLEGAKGFYHAYAGAVPELHFEHWDILDVTFKPFPGCAFNQASIQALVDMLAKHKVSGGELEEVTLHMSPADAAYPGVDARGPFHSFAGAIMSAQFVAAATLRDGFPKRRHFTTEYASKDLHDWGQRVRLAPDSTLAPWTARVSARLTASRIASAEFIRERPFIWNWNETLERLEPLLSEWKVPDARDRFGALSRLLATSKIETPVRRLMHSCTGIPKADLSAP